MEAVDNAPKVSVVENINRCGIVLKTTDIEGFFAHAYRPTVVETVLDVQEVGIVEKADRAGFGNDALAEEIGDVVADVTANQKVKILAVEAIIAVPTGLIQMIGNGVVGVLPLVSAHVFQLSPRLETQGGEMMSDFRFRAVSFLSISKKWQNNQQK